MGTGAIYRSGTITDIEGHPLVGVSVVIKGTNLGTVSDLDGKFQVDVPTPSATLEFSYLGYASVEHNVNASLIDEMLHQRRYSLYAEGHRWVDMRRHGKLNTLPIDRPGDDVWEQMPRPVSETE